MAARKKKAAATAEGAKAPSAAVPSITETPVVQDEGVVQAAPTPEAGDAVQVQAESVTEEPAKTEAEEQNAEVTTEKDSNEATADAPRSRAQKAKAAAETVTEVKAFPLKVTVKSNCHVPVQIPSVSLDLPAHQERIAMVRTQADLQYLKSELAAIATVYGFGQDAYEVKD